MTFHGTSRLGDPDRARVCLIQQRLNELGCGPVAVDGDFGSQTHHAVQLFQSRFTDSIAHPLTVDGVVGPVTWAALFEPDPAIIGRSNEVCSEALRIAGMQVGVMESPRGSNRGVDVDRYLRSVGINPNAGSFAWCAAFVFWCFEQASERLGRLNPCIKSAGALDHWRAAGMQGIRRITPDTAREHPEKIMPGSVFVLDTGGGHGHVGFVEHQIGGVLTTIEGNTNVGGSREGIGVFRRTGRSVWNVNRGFIDYGQIGGTE